ncbi:hypothetical protein MKX01_016698 [Papaver californicum]|nr:hypothetical protein MKX01_016698 [Papaver californicum]
MEILRSQKKISAPAAIPTLPVYRSAPSLEVRVEDFELFAIARLRVLTGISNGLSRGKKPDEMEKLANDLWKANMSELRKWFLTHETKLFEYRFCVESVESQKALMVEIGFPYKAVGMGELERNLNQVARSIGRPMLTFDALFFKVPFEEVPELIGGRKVYIHKVFAYVAMNQAVNVVTSMFRSNLSKALVLTNRKWTTTLKEQEKIIVEALSTSYLGPDYSQPKEYAEMSIKDIDKVASSSFPLCMRHLFEKLREDHHLKNGGRMQLGLFLKGVGLNLDDALAFWKAEFSQKVGPERFDKEYAYSIRHNYGKEGKRIDYTPYSCQKIISSTPGAGDQHGCPYRNFSKENLEAALSKMGVSSRLMGDVMDKVKNWHYQLACTLTFEAVHASSCDAGINHPNQYFTDSQKILQAKVINSTTEE